MLAFKEQKSWFYTERIRAPSNFFLPMPGTQNFGSMVNEIMGDFFSFFVFVYQLYVFLWACINSFFLLFFYFTILYWFCHTSTWICHGCTRVPHPDPPSHLRPHTIPLGHPNTPSPSFLYPALNLDWRFVSYMILYMFQCHSPKSSLLLPLPQSPKDCSIHLCLFCCLV